MQRNRLPFDPVEFFKIEPIGRAVIAAAMGMKVLCAERMAHDVVLEPFEFM